MIMTDIEEPDSHYEFLNVNGLAQALRRHRNYVTHMKRLGFTMPGGVATVAEARAWLAKNPSPRSRKRHPSNMREAG